MSLSEEEKEALRKEDFRKKARGLRLRLMENPAGSEEILPALDPDNTADRDLLESMLWEELLREMPSDKHIFQHLDLLEKLPPADKFRPLLKEAREAFKNASKTRGKDKKKILLREKKKLESWGISGSAVVPKLREDSETGSELTRVIEEYRERMLKEAARFS